jgi:hypothetical protein
MPVRLFKTKWFARYARKAGVSDQCLREAIERAERGIIDADLGGGLIKQRVARTGHGRSGGYRMLVAYRAQRRVVFLYGFAKNEKDNIEPDELASLQHRGLLAGGGPEPNRGSDRSEGVTGGRTWRNSE